MSDFDVGGTREELFVPVSKKRHLSQVDLFIYGLYFFIKFCAIVSNQLTRFDVNLH